MSELVFQKSYYYVEVCVVFMFADLMECLWIVQYNDSKVGDE